jgi:hypothetical protein
LTTKESLSWHHLFRLVEARVGAGEGALPEDLAWRYAHQIAEGLYAMQVQRSLSFGPTRKKRNGTEE